MKRERKLMILSGVLVVCVAGAVVVSRMDFEEKMTGTETTIVDVDSADITYLAWNYGDDQMAFAREDGEWSYETDAKMPVDQDLLDEIAENLSDITSDKMVEEVQNLSVYGLSDPSYNITIKTADDTWEIAVGDETFSDGEVYISDGDDYVYLTDAGLIDDISYSLLDCVQQDDIPEMESISRVKVVNDNTVNMIYKEGAGCCYSDAYTYYLKDGDTYRNLDNEKTEEAFTTLSDFAWEECADYYADDSELESYGLKEPDEVILLDWSTVDSIEMELDGNVYTVELEKSGDDEYKYTFNDEDIEFGDVLDQLSGITIAEDSGDEDDQNLPDGEPSLSDNKSELKFTFHRNTDDYSTVELEFYQYDGSYCISVLNGEELNYTDRSSVVDLKEAVNSVILDSGTGEKES